MGLDIIAYSRLTYADPQPETADEAHDEAVRLYNSNGFDRLLQPEGFYQQAADGDEQHINCGAYSRYGRWRDNLARLAGWPLGEDERYGEMWPSHIISAQTATAGPFLELIWFGDNDGCIGAAVSAKLAADFQAEREGIATRAVLMEDWEAAYFMKMYDEWAAAFALAADSGAVLFC